MLAGLLALGPGFQIALQARAALFGLFAVAREVGQAAPGFSLGFAGGPNGIAQRGETSLKRGEIPVAFARIGGSERFLCE